MKDQNYRIPIKIQILSCLYFPKRLVSRFRHYWDRETYLSPELAKIIDNLPGKWIIYQYRLVHHGWEATIHRLDNWKVTKKPDEYWLHSEDGFINVQESNKVDCKKYGGAYSDPEKVAKIIMSKMT